MIAPVEVLLREHRVFLDPGKNVFNLVVEDIDVFKSLLTDRGVKVVQCHRLDEFDPIVRDPDIDALLANSTGALLGH